MAIAVPNIGASSGTSATAPDIHDAASATSYTGGSVIPPTTGIAIAAVLSRRVGVVDTPTFSGWGITWTQIGSTLTLSTDFGLSLFFAPLSGATEGAVTADFGANTQIGCSATVFQSTGIDLSGGLSSAYVATNVQTATGTGVSGSITMNTAANSNNRVIAVFAHSANEANTAGTDFTLLDTLNGAGPARSIGSEYRSDAFDTAPDMSWSSSSGWGGFAVELVAEGGGTTTTLTADHGSFSHNGQAALFQTSVSVEHGTFS